MDLTKIGKYIAGKRKALSMTQKQLAEKLGMSDKSVSKWERGVCLPDVSVYSGLCMALGISINEFLAGEDIPQENVIQKSEENILVVAQDSKRRQKRLKAIICALLIVSFLAVSAIGITLYRAARPQNFITPLARDSIEMQTAELLAGADGAHIYKFTTTDEYDRFKLYKSVYHAGELTARDTMELGFDGIGSPENGEILIVPDFSHSIVKIVIAADGTKYATEYPILDGVKDREYYGRSATEIPGATDIKYNEEQELLALIYDNDEVLNIHDLMDGLTDSLAENDYVYFFSFEFCKE